MKKYKLINQDRTTRKGRSNETSWPIGEWREAVGTGGLCSDGMLHCYDDPYLALFLNPIHASIADPIVCEVEVSGRGESDGQFKCGYKKMRVVRDINIKAPTPEQRVEFAIWCGLLCYDDPSFDTWATKWLTGVDRSALPAQSALPALAAAWSAQAAKSATEATQLKLIDVAHFVLGADQLVNRG